MSNIEDVVPSEVKLLENKTVLSSKHVIYNWTVSNFSVLSKYAKLTIESSLFMIDNVPYQLRLETPGNVDDSEAAVPVIISLCRAKWDKTEQYINYKISLLDRKENPLVTQEEEGDFFEKQLAGRRMVFCLFENYKDCLQSPHDDALHVRCEASFLLQSHAVEEYDIVLDKKVQKSYCHSIYCRGGISFFLESLIFSVFLFFAYFIMMDMLDAFLGGNPYRCMKWNKEVDELVINSTRQMINIAKELNLTDVKDKVSKFLYAYAEQHDISVFNLTSLYK